MSVGVEPGVAIAAGLAAAALLLAVPPRRGRVAGPSPDRESATTQRRAGPSRTPLAVAALAGGAAVLVASLDGTDLALALIVAGVLLGLGRLQLAARRRRAAVRRREAVVEVGEALVGELRAGQPALAALARAAHAWPELAPAAAAARLGADVPTALRRLAALPGAEGLRELAGGWQVAERSGAPMVSVLTQVVESARARHGTDRVVRSELASAQTTARLVAVLPVLTLGMAAGSGADPWSFLTGHPVGLALLAAGSGLVLLGLAWIDRIAAGVMTP